MPRTKFLVSSDETKMSRPALTPEARENQMMSLAIDLAEKQLREGTASSQVITHFLKLASTREQLEKELLKKQTELMDAKTNNLQSAKKVEELYGDALKAMRTYSGVPDNSQEELPFDPNGGPNGQQ